MSAFITFPAGFDRNAICRLAGLDPEKMQSYKKGDVMEILGVDQAVMDQALDSYQHLGTLRKRKMVEILEERDRRLRESDVVLLRGIEVGGDLTSIKRTRQTLRDLPGELDLESLGVEELESFIPAWPRF